MSDILRFRGSSGVDALGREFERRAPGTLPPLGGPRLDVPRWPIPAPMPGPSGDPTPSGPPTPKPDADSCVGDCEERKERCQPVTLCFDKKSYPPKDYDEQAKTQEDEMRAMSPSDYFAMRDIFKTHAASYPTYYEARQAIERMAHVQAAKRQLLAEYIEDKGGFPTGLHALHRLDMVAGGWWDRSQVTATLASTARSEATGGIRSTCSTLGLGGGSRKGANG